MAKPESCSWFYSPHKMFKRQHIDFNKWFEFSFGTYVIGEQENKSLKNDMRPHGRDAIYLWEERSLQGRHRVLDFLTRKVITCRKITEVKLTDVVIKKVNEMAREQGLKSNKFFD